MFNEITIPDAVILAISVDSRENLKKTLARLLDNTMQSRIVLLSDPDHKVINQYGLLNPDSKGLPHPATYVIDKRGVVRWKFVDVNYKIRPDSKQVLKALKSIETNGK
jgi:peroxiredoxin